MDAQANTKGGGKTHAITWLSLIFIILTFLFFLASVFILEFAVTVGPDGDIVIPWYYWLFFVGAGVFLVIFVILQAIPVPYATRHDNFGEKKSTIVIQEEKRELSSTKGELSSTKGESPMMRQGYRMRDDTLYSLMR